MTRSTRLMRSSTGLRDDYESWPRPREKAGRPRSAAGPIGRASARTPTRSRTRRRAIGRSRLRRPEDSWPLTIKPSKHYRGASGPVEIEDIELADGSLYALMPPATTGTSSSRAPARAFRSRSATTGRRSTAAATSRAGSSRAARWARCYDVTNGSSDVRKRVRERHLHAARVRACSARSEDVRRAEISVPNRLRLKNRTKRARPQKQAPRAGPRAGASRPSAQSNRAPPSRAALRRPRTPQLSAAPPTARCGRRAP